MVEKIVKKADGKKKGKTKRKKNKKYAPKKTLADKVILVGHARIKQCFDWDVEEDSKDKKKKKKSETGDDENKVAYDNEDLQMHSPPQKSPKLADEDQFIQDVFIQSIPHWTIEMETSFPIFTTMVALNISACISFPWVMAKFGGWAFLIPFTLTTIFITVPINAMQYFLGQFTSAPPIITYYRMAPIFLGIGVLMNTTLYITASGVKMEHRFLSLAFEILFSLVTNRANDLRISEAYGALRGYIEICKKGEIFVNGKCFMSDVVNLRHGATDREYTQLMIQKFLQSDALYVLNSKADSGQKIFETEGSHYVVATFVLCLIAFRCSLKDLRTYTGKIKYFIFYGTIACCLSLLLFVANFSGYEALQFFDVVGYDTTLIFSRNAWVVALLQSFMIFSTGDGTFYALGMVNKFKNNFFKATVIQTLMSLCIMVAIGTSFGVAVCAGIILEHYKHEKRALTYHDMRNHIFNDNDIFKYLHIFFFQNLALKWSLLTFTFFLTTWQIFGQVVLANLVVSTMYRLIRSLVRLPEFLGRYIILNIHYTILGIAHILIFKQARRYPIQISPYIVLLQLISIFLFSPRKMLAAVLSTSNNGDLIFLCRMLIMCVYQIMVPIFIAISIIYDINSPSPSAWKIMLLPIALAVYSIIYHHMSSSFKTAINPTRDWGPATVIERKEHLKAERATCPDLM